MRKRPCGSPLGAPVSGRSPAAAAAACGTGGGKGDEGPGVTRPAPALAKRYYGSIPLDPIRFGKQTGQIAQEVIQHLTALVGADVEITLEIQTRVPSGVPDNIVRTVTENSRTLGFTTFDFEKE